MNKKLSYDEAKAVLFPIGIKSSAEYYKLFKEKNIPNGIPRNPSRDYSDFISWGDFLGTGVTANKFWVFKTYEESQEYLLSQGINSKEKFEKWRKDNKNSGIPSLPQKTYKNKWKGWSVFFKTNRIPDQTKHKLFYSYEDARLFLKKYNFKSGADFIKWAKTKHRPYYIPASPRKTYKGSFISMGDFLSNGNIKKEFKNYQDCKKIIQELKFNSIYEFKKWIKNENTDISIPVYPQRVYKNNFEGWARFLGYTPKESVGEKTISSILKSNNIKHKLQYKINNCKDINPLAFDVAILDNNVLICLIEYQGIQHFKPIQYFGGEIAFRVNKKRDKIKKNYCKNNNIKLIEISYKENIENKLKKELEKLGITIDLTLKREPSENRSFLSFEECKKLTQKLNIKSVKEYKKFKKHQGMPSDPNLQYKHNGWVSWGDFLGTNKIQSKKAIFVSFEECKKWFKDNNIKSGEDWKKKRKSKPINIPSHPDKIYKHQWKGWKDFLYN